MCSRGATVRWSSAWRTAVRSRSCRCPRAASCPTSASCRTTPPSSNTPRWDAAEAHHRGYQGIVFTATCALLCHVNSLCQRCVFPPQCCPRFQCPQGVKLQYPTEREIEAAKDEFMKERLRLVTEAIQQRDRVWEASQNWSILEQLTEIVAVYWYK